MMNSFSRAVALCSVAILLTACGQNAKQPWNGHDITGVMPDLSYTLINDTGEPATAADYAGKVRLVFFGYTSCPDICPVTLGHLQTAIGSLSKAQQQQLRVLFISVDPKRDTPKKLAKYTGYFGPDFSGLTGTQDQLQKITKRYRVTYGYDDPDDAGFYLVSHSSAVFVFGPHGKARLLFNQSLTPEQIAKDLRRLLQPAAGD